MTPEKHRLWEDWSLQFRLIHGRAYEEAYRSALFRVLDAAPPSESRDQPRTPWEWQKVADAQDALLAAGRPEKYDEALRVLAARSLDWIDWVRGPLRPEAGLPDHQAGPPPADLAHPPADFTPAQIIAASWEDEAKVCSGLAVEEARELLAVLQVMRWVLPPVEGAGREEWARALLALGSCPEEESETAGHWRDHCWRRVMWYSVTRRAP